MYGDASVYANANNLVRNEISFQNLIAIANNPVLFNALDEESQAKLIQAIVTYTKESLASIDHYRKADTMGVHHFSK